MTAEKEQLRLEAKTEQGRLRDEFNTEKEKLQGELQAERQRTAAITAERNELSVEKRGLEKDYASLAREKTRTKCLDLVAAILIAVGGGLISYAPDQPSKIPGWVALLAGTAVLGINALVGIFTDWISGNKHS